MSKIVKSISVLVLLFYFFLFSLTSKSQLKIDCSNYDISQSIIYANEAVDSEEYQLFKSCGSPADLYTIGSPYWINDFENKDWLFTDSNYVSFDGEDTGYINPYKISKEKPYTSNNWEYSNLGLSHYYCDTKKGIVDFDGDGFEDIYVSKYFGGTSSSKEGAFVSLKKKEVIGYHESSGELGYIWCDVNQNGIAEFRRVGQGSDNMASNIFVEYNPKLEKFVEATLSDQFLSEFKSKFEEVFYKDENFPDWIIEWNIIHDKSYFVSNYGHTTSMICSRADKNGELDHINFIKKFDFEIPEYSYDPFYFWRLAEKVSNDERFANNKNILVLQLICMEGGSPAAMQTATLKYFPLLNQNKTQPFNLCDHVTSGYGSSICQFRDSESAITINQTKLKNIENLLGDKNKKLLKNTLKYAQLYFDLKTAQEEGHFGTGYQGFVDKSKIEHIFKFLDRLEKLQNDNLDFFVSYDLESKKFLYNNVIKEVKDLVKQEKHVISQNYTNETLSEITNLWNDYHKSLSVLYNEIYPSIEKEQWEAFLYEERINNLVNIVID